MSHKTSPVAVLGDSVFDNQNYLHPDEKDGQALQDAFPDYLLVSLLTVTSQTTYGTHN